MQISSDLLIQKALLVWIEPEIHVFRDSSSGQNHLTLLKLNKYTWYVKIWVMPIV